MNNYICPFCNSSFPLINETYTCYESSFFHSDTSNWDRTPENSVHLNFYKCPTCNKISLTLNGISNDFKDIFIPIYPNSLAKQFPEYIHKAIRDDYEEAYSIVNLSPNASATLSRRCLQGMIRDFWNIKKSRLADAINELQDIVTSSQWKAIDSVRKIGNIGAHMESDINTIVDVDSGEAEKLLKLIELLIDKWYIARHDEDQLFLEVSNIADNKMSQKKSSN